jgi:hypothetical protein
MSTPRFLAALFLAAATAPMVEAQQTWPWEDTLDRYATGSLIAGQGGWETWDNNPAFDTIVTNAQSFNPPNSLLVSGSTNVIRPFPGGAPTGDLYFRVYIPSTHTGEVWLTVPSQYTPGGPYQWAVRVVMCVSACTSPGAVPGQIVNIGGDGVPGIGSARLPTDQWFVIWVTYNLPNFGGYDYAVGLNGNLFTPFQPWSGPGFFSGVNVFSKNGSPAYMDDFLLLEFVPVELMTITVE